MGQLVIQLHTLLIGELLALGFSLVFELLEAHAILFYRDIFAIDGESRTLILAPEGAPTGEEVTDDKARQGDPDDHDQQYRMTSDLL